MKRFTLVTFGLSLGVIGNPLLAQQPPVPQPFFVGNRLGLPVNPAADGAFEAISSNVKVYGAIYSAESCSYDATRDLIVVPNRGVPQNVQTNNAWVSLINHDGSVHTARWIGVQSSPERSSLTPPLVLNEPLGSDIANGMLYVADRDGGTTANDPSVAVIRRFDMRTGAPAGETRVDRSTGFNDIEVADDGTVYATQTGDRSANPDVTTWQVWKITPNGSASIFKQGAPLNQPNGVALDQQGNIVVVNVGSADVLTFAPSGQLLRTETAVQSGNDGIVIMRDGTKYVSSVINGGVSRIRPGQPAELIARNIPSAASMCYDPGANQLVIPMNANNALAFIRLDAGSPRQQSDAPVRTADPIKRGLQLSDFPRFVKLADNVYGYEEIRQPGFTTVSLVVIGRNGVLVADGQGNPQATQTMLDRIRTLTPLPVKWYVVGSDHGDHTAGNSVLPKDVTFIVHPTSRERLSPVPPTAMTGDREVIDVGGIQVHALFLGRAHTGGDLMVHLPRERILFMSEAYLNRVFPAMRSAFPSEWVRTIDRALAMDVTRYVPGHGFIEEPAASREELVAFRNALVSVIAEVKRLYALGLPVDAAVGHANWGPFADWFIREQQAPIAVRKVYEEIGGKLKP